MQDESHCTVHGPIDSWSFGHVVTIDLLYVKPVCSFRCLYCDLSRLSDPVIDRRVVVPENVILEDLDRTDWQHANLLAFTGNGEPTLASNLGDVIDAVRKKTTKPTIVMTNSSTLFDPGVRADLQKSDRVSCKLDAGDEVTFQQINRPIDDMTLQFITDNIASFAREYRGELSIEVMTRPMRYSEVKHLASILERIKPHQVLLNTPLTRVPNVMVPPHGGHDLKRPGYPEDEEVLELERELRDLTGLTIRSWEEEHAHRW